MDTTQTLQTPLRVSLARCGDRSPDAVAISALPVSRRLGNGVVLRDVIDVMSIHDRSMSGAEVHGSNPLVVELKLDGEVEPILAAYIDEGLADAARRHASLVLLTMDTPGGLSDSCLRAQPAAGERAGHLVVKNKQVCNETGFQTIAIDPMIRGECLDRSQDRAEEILLLDVHDVSRGRG